MRILVTGSRNWHDLDAIYTALKLLGPYGTLRPPTIVHGAANGADALAAQAAQSLGYHTDAHPADWKKHGKAAGPIRNAEMVALGADICLAFPMPGSIGTWDCIRKAVAAGIPVRIYPPRVREPERRGGEGG